MAGGSSHTPRSTRLRGKKFSENIHKKGNVKVRKPKDNNSVGPILLGFFLFVVVGSAFLQIIRNAQTGAPPS